MKVEEPVTFAFFHRFKPDLPDPVPVWRGHPRYNFVGGHNDPLMIPGGGLADAAAAVLREDAPLLAVYNLGHGPLGYEGLREGIARKLASSRGIAATVGDVLVTSGSGQGLDLVNALLVEPGDTVVVEELTYSGALNKLRRIGAVPVGAPLDAHGLDVDRLGSMLEQMRRRGVVPKYLYTIPTVHNPTGTILDLERRHRLIELSRSYGVPIFEDECYADLTWGAQAPPALYGLDPSRVIHIGSFSKTLAPALRIGYAVADPLVLRRMAALKNDGGTAAIDQMVVARYLREGFAAHARELASALAGKLDVMLEAIRREFGTTVDVARPAGGIFVWLRFPDGFDVRSLMEPAAARAIAFNPGPDWSCEPGRAANCMRLCFALPDGRTIRDGVAELAKVCFEVAGFPERGGNVARRR